MGFCTLRRLPNCGVMYMPIKSLCQGLTMHSNQMCNKSVLCSTRDFMSFRSNCFLWFRKRHCCQKSILQQEGLHHSSARFCQPQNRFQSLLDGVFLQPQEKIMRSPTLTLFKTLCEDDNTVFSLEDWQELEKRVVEENPRLAQSFETVCITFIDHAENLDLGKSLLQYIHSKGESPKLLTLSHFIRLSGKVGRKETQQMLFETFEDILKLSDMFSPDLSHYWIAGFSHTDRWRYCLDIIKASKLVGPLKERHYCPVVLAALHEGDPDLAVSLIDEMAETKLRPSEEVFQELIKFCGMPQSRMTIDNVLNLLVKHNWTLNEDTAYVVQEHFKSLTDKKYSCEFTTVSPRSICKWCHHQLKRYDMSDEDFNLLRETFLKNAVIGTNVYTSSTPQEVERFKQFVKQRAPFDLVIDSLNIIHNRSLKDGIKFLREMVLYFSRVEKKRILVISRKHKNRYNPDYMIERFADTFYTNRWSKDDPFALYASFYSGRSCQLVSKDFMRDHKFKLGPELKELFEQWQRSNQVFDVHVTRGGIFHIPAQTKHKDIPQKDAQGWHIPYEDEKPRPVFENTTTWLCVREQG